MLKFVSDMEHISVKIVVIGEPAVGKTTLRHAYAGKELGKTYAMTLGADIIDSKIELNDENVVMDIQIFDLAGQDTFDPLTRQFLRGTQGAIMVFDLTRDYTFDKVNMWLEKLHEENPKLDNNIPFIIVGNKADLDTFIKVDDKIVDEYIEYIGRHDLFSKTTVKYIKTSAKTGFKVKDAFYHLSKTIFINFQLLDGEITQEEANEALSTIQDLSDARKIDDARIIEEKKLEEQRKAEEAKLAEQRLAEQAKIAEQKRLEEIRIAEEARLADEKRLKEERLAAEAELVEQKRLFEEQKAEEARLESVKREAFASDMGIPKAGGIPKTGTVPVVSKIPPPVPVVDDEEEEAELAEIRKLVEIQKAKKAKLSEAKRREEAQKVEEFRVAEEKKLEEDKSIEQIRIAEEKRLEIARKAEEDRIAEQKRLEEARIAEEKRLVEARIVEANRLAEAEAAKEKELEILRAEESAASSYKLFFIDREFILNPKSTINSEAEIEICITHRKVTLTFGETAGLITKRITSIQAENISRSGYLLKNGERIGLGFELLVKEEN